MKLRYDRLVPLIGALSAVATAAVADPWKTDIAHQVLSARPKIEARYTDATRTGFEINAARYQIRFDLKSDDGQRISSLQVPGRGSAEVLHGKGIWLELETADGTLYSTLNSRASSRVNIYRRGPYYIETHWLDVQLADRDGKAAPIKGEVVFYSYPEKTHVGVILHPTADLQVKSAAVVIDADATTCASPTECKLDDGVQINEFVIPQRDSQPTCAVIYPVQHGVDDVTLEKSEDSVKIANYIYSADAHVGATATWKTGDKPAAYFELFPMDSADVSPDLEAEVRPLLSSAFSAKLGRTLGYDPIRGCYKIQTDTPGGFSYHFQHPNDYEEASFSVLNNSLQRKIYIEHETRKYPGAVECGVLLDDVGTTLPITVQISKNFAGEKEEPFYNPDDTPFSETYFPLYLGPDEDTSLTSLHLYQNWGSHLLKQFSSLGAWMDYYHMSTGVTETTCYVPFLFGGIDGVSIADFRPMSQRLWDSQPQHDNVAGHSFLRYQDDKGLWHFLEYAGTTFRSTGPNWADVSMGYLSDDGAARVTVDIFELPQTDELRNFIHMRIDFLKDIKIRDGDFARNVRLLNIASWVQRLRYTTVAFGGPTGDVTETTIRLNDDFTLAGSQLPAANGFAAIYPDKKGANAYVVRRFDGSIGGESVTPGVSVFGEKKGDTTLMLVPVTKAKEIKAGDWLEIDAFMMPYGGGTEDWKPAQKAAMDYGLNAPKIANCTTGAAISDFPTRVRLDDQGRAEFSVTGGMNCIPIIVEGAKDYTCLRLYNIDGEKKLVDLAQTGERDGYQVFAKDDGTFGWVFLVNTDGKEHRYAVE